MGLPIYTYFEPVHGLSIEDSTRLLLLWRQNWTDKGHEPIVLNEHIARKHPMFAEYDERIRKFPSINPEGYDRACWMRWLAMAQMGGGWMLDYDVFNYTPMDWGLDFMDFAIDTPKKKVMSQQKHIPSFVGGDAESVESLIRWFINYQVTIKDVENDRPHVSDMHILLRSKPPMIRADHYVVSNYGEPGWERKRFVHFANATMRNHQPRWKYIRQLRNWK